MIDEAQMMAEQQQPDPEWEELFLFDKAAPLIKQQVGQFQDEVLACEQRRKERYADIDPEKLRETGEIQPDETFIADRLIDGNIMRDLPDKAGFLLSDGKLGDFRCLTNPNKEAKNVEKEFTEGLTYSGWYKDWYRTMDGATLHGRDYLEVVFDPTKPLHVGFEHVGFDKLFFNRKVENIQDSERVIRQYDMTLFKLRTMPKFAQEQTQKLYDKYKDRRRDETIKVYKIYTKYANCVYVHWYCEEADVTDWLSAPEKLYIGIDAESIEMVPVETPIMDEAGNIVITEQLQPQTVVKPVEIDFYPIFTYIYREDESECLVEKRGRAFLDFPMQEANTAIITGFVNAVVRASNVYASPEGEGDSDGGDIKQLDTVLEHGKIYNKPLKFWGTNFPPLELLQGVQFLQTMNAQSAGKFSFATNNRKDSRKTAKELTLAESEENKVKTTDLATFSEFTRAVLSFCWLIVQSRAKQNKIRFLQIEQEQPMMAGAPTMGTTPVFVNDIESISELYDIRPAGEAAMERQQEIQKRQMDWPVVQNTPLAPKFLIDYIRLQYPEEAEEYAKILEAGDVGKQLVASLSTLLQAFIQPQEFASLSPEQKNQLLQIGAAAQQYISGGTEQQQQQQQQQQQSNE
jgi:hypothetical protein